MKVLISICVLVFAPLLSKAQEDIPIKKGNMFFGGGFDYEHSKKHVGVKTNTIELSPNTALFIKDNLALGIRLNSTIVITKGNLSNSDKYIEREFLYTVSPFIRYYLTSHIFSEGEIGYLRYLYNHESNPYTKFWGYHGSACIGYSIFLNNHIAVEPIFSYKYEYIKNLGSEDFTSKNNILDFSIRINSFF